MGQVIDTCVWIDYLRTRTLDAPRQAASSAIHADDALLCEPVRFELLCGAARRERTPLSRRLETMPLLPTPATLWREAAEIAQKACDSGLRIPSMDLLITALCLHHDASVSCLSSIVTGRHGLTENRALPRNLGMLRRHNR